MSLGTNPIFSDSGIVKLEEPNVLRTCVNHPPKGYNSIRPHGLSDLNDLKIQQGLIIKDLIFVFLGYEGFYVRYNEKYDPNSIESKIRGPDYKTAKHLDISLKSITKKLVKFGKYYSALKSFNDFYNTHQSGKVLQKLCYEILRVLNRYEKLILQVEQEFNHNPQFNLNYLENNIIRKNQLSIQMDLLYEIAMIIHDDSVIRYQKYKENPIDSDDVYFAKFIKSIENDLQQTGSIDLATDKSNFELCKGGLILQIIQRLNSQKYKGDSIKNRILMELFDSISTDYVDMLNAWLVNGEINDPFDEFLVKENIMDKTKFSSIINNYSEKYWEEVYVTRTDGIIEQFQNRDLQLKILATGRYLNIFKLCTGVIDTNVIDNSIDKVYTLSSRDLDVKINEFYIRANKLLMKLYFQGYYLPQLINKLERTFLLNDSYNIDNFIAKTFNDLRRSKYAISTTKLKKQYDQEHSSDELNNDPEFLSLDTTLDIDNTNFYELAREILDVQSFDAMEAITSSSANFKTLLNKSLESKGQQSSVSSSRAGGAPETSANVYDPDHSDEYSITGLNLSATIQFPLNLMIGQNFIFQYQLIFKLLVLVKFISKLSDNTWKEINYSNVWKYKRFHPKIGKWILRCRILLNRMSDFVRELQFYFNIDVIDSNCKEVKEIMRQIEKQLSTDETGKQASTQRNTGKSGANPERDIHSDRFSTFNNNSIFDRNIFQHQQTQRNVSTNSTTSTTTIGTHYASNSNSSSSDVDVIVLRNKISSFLNNILRHSLVTNKDLLQALKSVCDLIISYNHFLTRLKKSIVLLDVELYDTFRQNYPEKFEGKIVDDASITERYEKLNDRIAWYYESFGDTLTDFMNTLKAFGETEDQALLILVSRLEKCYPE